MPKVKFQDVDETQQFKVIPEGDYVAEIVKVEETKTKNDDDMWKVQFKVIEGEHTGTSIFSYFVFNEGGYGNIKKLYKEIGGFDLAKAHNCVPSDIEGEKVVITVAIGEYTNREGNKVKNNSIPYGGFKNIDDEGWD
jgi:hypothetical protein|nr:MAG TPA: Protein of unknown function (DUF669) [Caudoviricetes sp.]